jgi:coproporphyrinogen III oxidase
VEIFLDTRITHSLLLYLRILILNLCLIYFLGDCDKYDTFSAFQVATANLLRFSCVTYEFFIKERSRGLTSNQPLRDRARAFFAALQDEICSALEALDGAAKFREDLWTRDGGGGGRTRVIENGALFEKGGVNFSAVHGKFDEAFASRMPVGSGTAFFATGVSLVLHPLNPIIPTVHANFRYLERGSGGWFGGGTDLTPYYPYREDAVHFHQTLKAACDSFDASFYRRFKRWCDDYFFLKHRNEARGIGGIFFDYLTGEGSNQSANPQGDHSPGDLGNKSSLSDSALTDSAGDTAAENRHSLEDIFEFVQTAGHAFLPAYLPIVERRRGETFTEREREFQMIRRGRYVEFNLVYDRGTTFGLETRGRTESILMSLPPIVRWVYDYKPEPNSREAEAWDFFKAQDWLGIEGAE